MDVIDPQEVDVIIVGAPDLVARVAGHVAVLGDALMVLPDGSCVVRLSVRRDVRSYSLRTVYTYAPSDPGQSGALPLELLPVEPERNVYRSSWRFLPRLLGLRLFLSYRRWYNTANAQHVAYLRRTKLRQFAIDD